MNTLNETATNFVANYEPEVFQHIDRDWFVTQLIKFTTKFQSEQKQVGAVWVNKKTLPKTRMKYYCIRIKNEDRGKYGLDEYQYDQCFVDEHNFTAYFLYDFEWLDESASPQPITNEAIKALETYPEMIAIYNSNLANCLAKDILALKAALQNNSGDGAVMPDANILGGV